MIAALLEQIRGIFSTPPIAGDIVRSACLEPAAEIPQNRAAPIAMYYYVDVKNVGDRISPTAVQYATGRPTYWTRRRKNPHLLGLGSILSVANAHSHIWGTGLMHPSRGVEGVRGDQVWAVRGKLTHAFLASHVTGLRDVPLGDPGYLVGRRLAQLAPKRNPTHRVGLIPHYQHRDHPAIGQLAAQDGVMMLDVRDPESRFFSKLMSCAAVASSSLHGLIFAEALGIPNVWIGIDGQDTGGGPFKFHDWFTLAAQPQSAPLRINTQPQAKDLESASALHEFKIEEEALRTAIPASALKALRLSSITVSRVKHFLTCRRRRLPIFVLARGAGAGLADVIATAQGQSATEIIVIDISVTNPAMTAEIRRLKQAGVKVRIGGPCLPEQETATLHRIIRRHFARWGEPIRFGVADCTTGLRIPSSERLALYDELLDRIPNIDAVGPAPYGDDVCPRDALWYDTAFGRVPVTRGTLRGGFALRRIERRFRESVVGLRVHHAGQSLT